MCKALRGTELNSGSVQVKYILIIQCNKIKMFLVNSWTVTVTSTTAFSCKDSSRAFVNVLILGSTKAAECSEDGFNFGCPKLRPL